MKQTLTGVLLACLILGHRISVGYSYLLDADCGASKYTYRITGGKNTAAMLTPWLAYLHINSTFICGGSLLNHWFVLTAAHCFHNVSATILVRLGENDASQKIDCNEFECAAPYSEFVVMQRFIYPLYRTARNYDIALGKLSRHVAYTDSIRPICLMLNPQWQGYLDTVKYFTIFGWGATNVSKVSVKLQHTRIPQIDRFSCRYWYGYNVDRTHICAGESRHYVGTGDSGGPLGNLVDYNQAKRFFQFGIVSHLRHPFQGVSVFTNILSYSHWIHRTITANSL
ncbi:serine protease grass [Drosophila santomea]|uniref:serine protease grass n=1 Tax=Drosophila santomea TaxID=129105 RepID=UPI001952C6B0|nr:serine protease grass [Drosophila santomea]